MAYILRRASGQVTSAGNNTLLTPSSGKRLEIHYAAYNPAADVEIGFRFGVSGPLWLQNNLVGKSVISKDFGDAHATEGEKDEPLILNLSLAVVTNWTVFYLER